MLLSPDRLDWTRDGADWPNREASRFVRAADIEWHVQMLGAGPPLLLIHGTGAATHSWRALAPLLAARFSVIAMDLPAHGFTSTPFSSRLALPGMAEAVATLLKALPGAPSPQVVVGHSAGAAVALRMALDDRIAPKTVISLNGALRPFQGMAGTVFPALARMLFLNPFTPRAFAFGFSMNPSQARRMIQQTGSALDPEGLALYARLARSPAHVAGALGMMANWDLEPLVAELPRLAPPLDFITGADDATIPPIVTRSIAERFESASYLELPGLGHLAHEEAPERFADLLIDIAHVREAL